MIKKKKNTQQTCSKRVVVPAITQPVFRDGKYLRDYTVEQYMRNTIFYTTSMIHNDYKRKSKKM